MPSKIQLPGYLHIEQSAPVSEAFAEVWDGMKHDRFIDGRNGYLELSISLVESLGASGWCLPNDASMDDPANPWYDVGFHMLMEMREKQEKGFTLYDMVTCEGCGDSVWIAVQGDPPTFISKLRQTLPARYGRATPHELIALEVLET